MMKQYKAFLFLDLDGTVRKGYDETGKFVNGPEDVEVFPEAVREIERWAEVGYLPYGVTNQGGVSLGYFSRTQMNAACLATNKQCNHLFLDILACTHHPDAKEPRDRYCLCRKPHTGLLVIARETIPIHCDILFERSVMVGDMDSDRQCAANAGITYYDAKDWRAGLDIPKIV